MFIEIAQDRIYVKARALIGQRNRRPTLIDQKGTAPVKLKLAPVCAKKKTEILLKCILFF